MGTAGGRGRLPTGPPGRPVLTAGVAGHGPAPWEAEEPGRGRTARPAFTRDLCPQQLKQQRDKLRQYQRRVTQQLEREREVARQLLREGRKE